MAHPAITRRRPFALRYLLSVLFCVVRMAPSMSPTRSAQAWLVACQLA